MWLNTLFFLVVVILLCQVASESGAGDLKNLRHVPTTAMSGGRIRDYDCPFLRNSGVNNQRKRSGGTRKRKRGPPRYTARFFFGIREKIQNLIDKITEAKDTFIDSSVTYLLEQLRLQAMKIFNCEAADPNRPLPSLLPPNQPPYQKPADALD